MPKPKQLWVKAVKGIDYNGRVGEHQVLLFEKDDAHPNGEAFIAGPLPVLVGDTSAVAKLLKDGDIEETSAPEPVATADPLAARIAELERREAELAAREAAVAAASKPKPKPNTGGAAT